MSRSVDRRRIEGLLTDKSRSLRSIARTVGCSDWSVRRIAREHDDDSRSRRHPEISDYEQSEVPRWVSPVATIAVLVGLAICTAFRNAAVQKFAASDHQLNDPQH